MATYRDLELLEKNCIKLLENYVTFSNAENERRVLDAQQQLLHAIRKITIAVEFNNIQIVSVSGLQGTGKSTMIQNFFGLPDGLLKVTTGRGEQIPVLISEHEDCQGYDTYAICLEKKGDEYQRVEKEISHDDFIRYSSGDIADEENIIYLELHLPYKRINDSGLAFMLLPGFEEKQDYWNDLIEFSLSCSESSIFVFDQNRYSRIENKNILDRVKKAFNDALIYAISRSDLNKDTAEEFREKCIRELEVEPDRVINVGTYLDNEKNEEWIVQLANAVSRYCNNGMSAVKRTNRYILDTINNEIMPQLSFLRDILNREQGADIIDRIERDDSLRAFDKIVSKKRKHLERLLKKAMEEAEMESCEKLEKIYSDDSYAKKLGVEEKPFTSIRKTLLGEKVQDKIFARERLKEAMTDDDNKNPRVYYFQKAFAKALEENLEDWRPEESKGSKYILDGVDPYEVSVSEETPKIGKRQNELLHDVNLLLSTEIVPGDTLKIGDLQQTCECIADMAVQYLNVYAFYNIYCVNRKSTEGLPLEKLHVDIKETLEKANNFETVILGGLGITGADLLGDGALTAIPSIANAMGVSVPLVASVVGMVAAVGVAGAIIKDINRLQMTEVSGSEAKIREISQMMRQSYLDAYDSAMETVKDRIKSQIEKIKGNIFNTGRRINAIGLVNHLTEQINDIRIEINAQSSSLEKAFR